MTKKVKDIWVCKEDAKHHADSLGTAFLPVCELAIGSPIKIDKQVEAIMGNANIQMQMRIKELESN